MTAPGFSFGGIHSSEYRSFTTDIPAFVLPTPRDHYEYIPGSDSTILFSQGLEDQALDFELVVQHTFNQRIDQLRRVAAWLHSKEKQQLIFDEQSDVFYLAKWSDSIIGTKKRTHTVLQLSFIAEPYAFAIQRDLATFSINAPGELENTGTYEALPIIKIQATTLLSQIKVRVNGAELRYKGTLQQGETLVIDRESLDIYRLISNTKIDQSMEVEGFLPILQTGTNLVEFNATGTGNVTTEWRRRYV